MFNSKDQFGMMMAKNFEVIYLIVIYIKRNVDALLLELMRSLVY